MTQIKFDLSSKEDRDEIARILGLTGTVEKPDQKSKKVKKLKLLDILM